MISQGAQEFRERNWLPRSEWTTQPATSPRRAAALVIAATASSASAAAPQVMSSDHSISFAGAEINVVAQDSNKMAKSLQQEAKLARLVRPTWH